LWLKEGFATYFEYFAIKMVNRLCLAVFRWNPVSLIQLVPHMGATQVNTAWPMEELFVVEIHQNALSYDQRVDRPLTSPANSPKEIENQFDLATYRKSASLLRSLRYLVTEKLFQLSIRNYLSAIRWIINFKYFFFDNDNNHRYYLFNKMFLLGTEYDIIHKNHFFIFY
jgi:aminopeptidase N